jgi:hypothetical protein
MITKKGEQKEKTASSPFMTTCRSQQAALTAGKDVNEPTTSSPFRTACRSQQAALTATKNDNEERRAEIERNGFAVLGCLPITAGSVRSDDGGRERGGEQPRQSGL